MELTMLGTGHAMVTEYYNTCFTVSENDRHFLVDGGGGNGILRQLKYAGLSCRNIHEIFITHKHTDHLLGIIWVARTICQQMAQGAYEGEVNIYAHKDASVLIQDLLEKLLLEKQLKFLKTHFRFISVEDGQQENILGRTVTFFDIQSAKEKQFGFCMELEKGEKLTCCGDEPCHPCSETYAQNSKWLMHEAFCLYSQADLFSPYEKHHSTVRDACELAETLDVRNLILYHTEDTHPDNRKQLYLKEGKKYFHGNLYVPDDLEKIPL